MIATHSTEMIGPRPDSGDGTLSPCSPARDGQLAFVSHPFNLVLDKLTNTNANTNSNANTNTKKYRQIKIKIKIKTKLVLSQHMVKTKISEFIGG